MTPNSCPDQKVLEVWLPQKVLGAQKSFFQNIAFEFDEEFTEIFMVNIHGYYLKLMQTKQCFKQSESKIVLQFAK